MPLNFQQVRQHLDQFEFGPLFIEELGNYYGYGRLASQDQGTF